MIQFKDAKNQKKFEQNGFVSFDLLNEREVELLKDTYTKLERAHTNPDENLFSSIDNDNLDLTYQVEEAIRTISLDKLKGVISEFDYLFSTFLIKKSASKNATPFHQDPTLIDKKESVSANIWIALEDSTEKNGGLRFIPGSHKILNSLVVTPDFYTYYNGFQEKLKYYTADLKIRKGQAVIFNNKLVHGAYPNTSGRDRVAAVIAVKSINTPWCYYYLPHKTKEGEVEKYLLNKEQYGRIQKNSRPESFLKMEKFFYKFPEISFTKFNLFMFRNYPKLGIKGLFKSIFK